MASIENMTETIEKVSKSVEEATETMKAAANEIRRLRVALLDIDLVVEDSVDINKNNGPNMAMRVSMIVKQALDES